MKPQAFRIQHYKSIRDTGVCSLNPDVTVLIGVNEAGKTAILEALGNFDREAGPFAEATYPLDGSGVPRVSVGFSLGEEEWQEVVASLGLNNEPEEAFQSGRPQGLIWITKDAAGRYAFDEEQNAPFGEGFSETEAGAPIPSPDEIKQQAAEELTAMLQQHGLDTASLETLMHRPHTDTSSVVAAVKNLLPRVADEAVHNKILALVRQWIEPALPPDAKAQPRGSLLQILLERMPRFFYYNDFKDCLPFEVDLERAKEHSAVMDFVRLSGLDLDELNRVRDVQRRYNILSRHTATLAGDFLTHWRQNEVVLQIYPVGEKLVFGVREKDRPELFRINQRSRGFQWFLSFYLKLHTAGGRPVVWLIDEPGMHLHPQSQKDILTIIQKVASKDCVVYTTHSPYMIDTSRVDGVRVVIKTPQQGTHIITDLSRVPDEASWQPLRAALDTTVSTMIHPSRPLIVVVRAADYFYLRAMEQYLYSTALKDIDVIPLARVENIEMLLALLIARQVAFKILVPADERLIQRLQQALARHPIAPEQWVRPPVQAEGTGGLENLFAPEDRCRYLLDLQEEGVTVSQAVTGDIITEMAERGLNPDAVARQFHQRVARSQDVVLQEATQRAFRDLFCNLVEGLKPWMSAPQVAAVPDSSSGSVSPG